MKSITRFIAITALGLMLPLIGGITSVHAQSIELVLKAESEVEVEEKGVKVKKVAPLQKMVPGDEALYTLTYANKTAKPAEKIVITNPVPKHTRYKNGSAAGEGADIVFSADDGKTFATPDKLTVTVKDASGKDVTRPATAADYTHIRWRLRQDVEPGRTGTVTFRAVIL